MSVIPAPTSSSRSRVTKTRAPRSRRSGGRERGQLRSTPPEHGAYREPTPTLEQIAVLDSAGLALELPGVDAVTLPHRTRLEAGLGEPLDGIRVLSGPLVAEALDTMDADGAALGDRVFLRDDRAPLDTVAHEVVHVLQARSSTAGASPIVDSVDNGDANFSVEHEAERAARLVASGEPAAPVPEIRSPLDPTRAALRTTAVRADRDGARERQRLRRALADESSTAESEQDTTDVAAETVTTPRSAGDVDVSDGGVETVASSLEGETPQPTFEAPEMPETALSAEEQAARHAQLAEAEAAIAQATTGSGVVGAFADAQPSVKASAQATLGERVREVVASEEQTFQGELPELKAEMGGELEGQAVPPVQAPAARDVSLETGTPSPAPDPSINPTPEAEPYRANDAISAQVSRLFGGDPASAVGQSLSAVRTTDPDLTATPGTPPTVPMEGENDPARMEQQRDEAARQSTSERDAAVHAVLEGPGPEQARLRQLDETYPVGELTQPELAGVVPAAGAAELSQMALPEEVLARFDEDEHAAMQASVAEAGTQIQEAEQTRDTDREAEVTQAGTDRAKLVEQADSDQREQVRQARTSIQSQRQVTIDDQAQAVRDLETEADRKRGEDRGAIDERVRQDQASIEENYRQAEKDARDKVEEGEREAETEKKKAERDAENQSWWDKAVSFVKEAFAALTSIISAIFDKIRAAVNTIIDKAKDFAKGLIDLAAAFIKKTIAAFGAVLKGLVTALLADAFPGLARRLNEAIDGAVELASKAVDFVADKLKAGVEALAGALQAALNKILDVFQGAINFALGALEAVLTGDWSGLARKVLEAVLRVLGIDPVEFYALIGEALDTVKIIVDAPGKFIGHLLDAVVLGFQNFAGNFLAHLKAGVIKWLTGALGDIQIPEKFDLAGLFDLGRQILGLTWDWIKKKAAKVIGEKNVERLEFVFSYVETLREGGFSALFERIKDELTGLAESVLGQIKEFLVVKLILAGIKWLASLFSPVGAVVKLVMTIWNLIQFLREQLARMIEVAKAVISSIANIARGVIEAAGARVEQVLGDLLPIAIDLVAKLLGLTGVSKKVREVIGTIREKIDKAVDKLIAKALARFKSKGGEEDEGEGEGAKGEIRVGEVLPVPVPGGKPHELRIEVRGTDAVPVLRSEVAPVKDWLVRLEAKVSALDPEHPRRKEAETALATANTRLKQLDPLSDEYVEQAKADKSAGKPVQSDAKIDEEQERLFRALVTLFEIVGGETVSDDDVISRLAMSDPKVRNDLWSWYKANAGGLAGNSWSEIRTSAVKNVPVIKKPLLKGTVFGDAFRKIAIKLLREIEKEPSGDEDKALAVVPPGTDAEDKFLSNWLLRTVHTDRQAIDELQRVAFGELSANDASEALGKAVRMARKGWASSGADGVVDPTLKKAAKGKIDQLLLAVATGGPFPGLELKKWDTDYWGTVNNPNRKWIARQFRAIDGGKHEWIPTNYVNKVIEHARGVATSNKKSEGVEAAAAWIELHKTFRSETELLIFNPNVKGYSRTVKTIQKPGTTTNVGTGQFTVLQGHIGAVHAPISSSETYRDEVVGQTKNQKTWHDKLRGLFDSAVKQGASKKGMKEVVDGVSIFARETIWDGETMKGEGFTEYYPAARESRASPYNLSQLSELEKTAKSARDLLKHDFDKARSVYQRLK